MERGGGSYAEILRPTWPDGLRMTARGGSAAAQVVGRALGQEFGEDFV